MDSPKMPTPNIVALTLYVGGFVGLTCFAIYDLKSLITDFIEDNRVTVVKPVNITDSIPFLHKMRTCLYHLDRPVFPGRPITFDQQISMAREYWLHGWNESWNELADFDKDRFEIYGKATLDDYTIHHIGTAMEKFDCETDQDPYGQVAAAHNMSKADLMRVWDAFVTDPNRVGLVREAWNALDAMLLRRESGLTATSYFPDPCNKQGAEAKRLLVPLQDDVTESAAMGEVHGRSRQYFYDFPNFVNSSQNLTTTWIGVVLPGLYVPITNSDIGTSKWMFISIYNIAVFNNVNFPPCTEDFETERECLDDLRMRTIREICGCAVFMETLKRVINKNETTSDTHRFCTTAILEKCAKQAFAAARENVEAVKKEGTCTPCVIPKNTYSFMEKIFPATTDQPRGSIVVSCPDTRYILFEDKPQFSWSQMVSQVGGDLGLFLGFSMLTVLQAILYFYHHYFAHKEHHTKARKENKKPLHKLIVHYLIKSFHEGHDDEHRRESLGNAAVVPAAHATLNQGTGQQSFELEDRMDVILRRQAEFEHAMERKMDEEMRRLDGKLDVILKEVKQLKVKRK